MNPSVQKAIYKSPHLLMMTFTNNETKQFDLSKYTSITRSMNLYNLYLFLSGRK